MRQMGARGPRTGRPTDQATALPISPPLDRDTNSQVIGGWGRGGREERILRTDTKECVSPDLSPFPFSGAMSPTYTVVFPRFGGDTET